MDGRPSVRRYCAVNPVLATNVDVAVCASKSREARRCGSKQPEKAGPLLWGAVSVLPDPQDHEIAATERTDKH